MKKLFLIGAPLVAVSFVGGLILHSSQTEALERGCLLADNVIQVIDNRIGVAKAELIFLGRTSFSEGKFLVEARGQVRTLEDFPRLVEESWLVRLTGTMPQDMDFWISATSAARAYLVQLENAGLTGDYSNARNFGTEIQAVAIDAESRDVCAF
jgi:hypothetical protein